MSWQVPDDATSAAGAERGAISRSPNPHDDLGVKREKELAAWLVHEIQQVEKLVFGTLNQR